MQIFNDEKFEAKAHLRTHMIYMTCVIVAKSAEGVMQSEAKKWDGARDIAYGRYRKKYQFIGREDFNQKFNDNVINTKLGTFKGVDKLTNAPPLVDFKLWPITCINRTLSA